MNSPRRRQSYLSGLKAGIPVVLGFLPVGMAYAVMARQAGLSVTATILMSACVFAGASQMMAVGMYAQGAGLLAIVTATFVLNLRHLIMSACVMNRMEKTSPELRLLAGFGVTDESFAIFSTDPQGDRSVFFFLGLITAAYSSWVAGTAVGAAVSDILPASLNASLGIALYAMFLGILAPNLRENLPLACLAVLTAVCNALLMLLMPSSWALILSTLLCAGAGVFFIDLPEKREPDHEA